MKRTLLVCGLAVFSLMAAFSTSFAESPGIEGKTVLERNHGRYGYGRGRGRGWNWGRPRRSGGFGFYFGSRPLPPPPVYYYPAQPVYPVYPVYRSGTVYYCR